LSLINRQYYKGFDHFGPRVIGRRRKIIGLGMRQRRKKKGFSLERERKEREITIFGFC